MDSWGDLTGAYLVPFNFIYHIIKDLFFNEIDLLTEDKHKDSGLYMISLIAQLKDY